MKHPSAGLLICLLAVVAPAAVAAVEVAPGGDFDSAREHRVELGLEDVRLLNEAVLPSIEQPPTYLLPADPPCPLLAPRPDCLNRADLKLSPEVPDRSAIDADTASGLHRLRREVRESQGPHTADHLIEHTLERLVGPAED